jgi:hypothetical protein
MHFISDRNQNWVFLTMCRPPLSNYTKIMSVVLKIKYADRHTHNFLIMDFVQKTYHFQNSILYTFKPHSEMCNMIKIQLTAVVPSVSPGCTLNDTFFNTSGSPFLYWRVIFWNFIWPLLGQSDGGLDITPCFPSHSRLYKQADIQSQ